ncbi:MAG TPA: enolase C-terminal domain-like protein [Kofleriaceae bacterium]|jgi:O-succinylbenzoate synthase
MIVARLDARAVRWPIAPGGAARSRAAREAVLVEVFFADGARGLGEAAPLPGVSRESLGDVRAALAGLRLPADPDAIRDAIAGLPSARFALETAMLGAEATRRGVSLAQLLSRAPAAALAAAAVVDTPDEAVAAWTSGFRTLKVKVGGDPDEDRARVLAIAAAVPGAALRLDANGAWTRAQASRAVRGLLLEFIEEPCAQASDWSDAPVALDESLIAGVSVADVFVCKPTLLGGLAAVLGLAATSIPCVVSHALEGPIGTAACAELALAVGGPRAAGLGPHGALAGWRIAPPQLRGASVVATGAPGLGFGALSLDDVLAAAPPGTELLG